MKRSNFLFLLLTCAIITQLRGLLLFVSSEKLPTRPALYASVGGYITQIDHNNQLRFPIALQPPFYVLVTTQIWPSFLTGNTVATFTLPPHVPAQFYHITKGNDENWHIEPITAPEKRDIDAHTLIIFAHPDNISFHSTSVTGEEEFPTLEIYHQISPQILARLLAIMPLFSPVTTQQQSTSYGYAELIT